VQLPGHVEAQKPRLDGKIGVIIDVNGGNVAGDRIISILDVTVRDGSYAIDYQFTPEMVAGISRGLDEAGIDYIEVSHGCGLGASENLGLTARATDAEYVRAAKASVEKARIGVIAGPAPVTKPKDIDTVIDEVDFIRFFTPCSDPRGIEENMEYALKRRADLPVFMQLTNSTRRPAKDIIEAGRVAESLGVKTMYVVDTTSHFLPNEVSDLIGALTSELGMGVGFHGHDSLSLAVANTIAAVRAGATAIDASLRGIGRGGGNAQLEIVVSLLNRLGLADSYDIEALIITAEKQVEPIMPPRKGVSPIDLITADANISLYPIDLYQRISQAADVSLIDLIVAIGADSETVDPDLESIRRALTKLGADPDSALSSLKKDRR